MLQSAPRTMFDARATRRARDTGVAAPSGLGESDIEKVGLYVIGQGSTSWLVRISYLTWMGALVCFLSSAYCIRCLAIPALIRHASTIREAMPRYKGRRGDPHYAQKSRLTSLSHLVSLVFHLSASPRCPTQVAPPGITPHFSSR